MFREIRGPLTATQHDDLLKIMSDQIDRKDVGIQTSEEGEAYRYVLGRLVKGLLIHFYRYTGAYLVVEVQEQEPAQGGRVRYSFSIKILPGRNEHYAALLAIELLGSTGVVTVRVEPWSAVDVPLATLKQVIDLLREFIPEPAKLS